MKIKQFAVYTDYRWQLKQSNSEHRKFKEFIYWVVQTDGFSDIAADQTVDSPD